jgi:hypothetical protein
MKEENARVVQFVAFSKSCCLSREKGQSLKFCVQVHLLRYFHLFVVRLFLGRVSSARTDESATEISATIGKLFNGGSFLAFPLACVNTSVKEMFSTLGCWLLEAV